MDDLAREEKPKLVIGLIYSYNDGATSAFGTNGGRFLYGDSSQNVLLPKYSKLGVDYLFKYNGFYSMASFFATNTIIPNNIKGEFRLNGQFAKYANTQTEAFFRALWRELGGSFAGSLREGDAPKTALLLASGGGQPSPRCINSEHALHAPRPRSAVAVL